MTPISVGLAVVVAAALTGAVAGALGGWPEAVEGVLAPIGATLTPLALFSVGLQFKFHLGEKQLPALLLGLGWKLLLAPLAALALGVAAGVGGLTLTVGVLQAAMAPMISAAILADEHRLDKLRERRERREEVWLVRLEPTQTSTMPMRTGPLLPRAATPVRRRSVERTGVGERGSRTARSARRRGSGSVASRTRRTPARRAPGAPRMARGRMARTPRAYADADDADAHGATPAPRPRCR